MSKIDYISAYSPFDPEGLGYQSRLIDPITRRLLQGAGLGSGMSVLDLGCGTGEVSFLAARLVGPGGWVHGIDRNGRAVATARRRASEAGLAHVTFQEADLFDYAGNEKYDLVIGRSFLIHQTDAAAAIRIAASHVRGGGAVAFHEPALDQECASIPPVPLVTEMWNLCLAAFRSALPHPDVAGKLVQIFIEAGLGEPALFCEVPTGGAEALVIPWMVQTLRSVVPEIERLGVANAAELGLDTLEFRARRAAREARMQITAPMQFCAWSRVSRPLPRSA